MYPLDSVKTRMQSIQPNPHATYKTIPEALYKMVRNEGLFRPVRGMSAVVTGAGPAHALYYSCYEHLKFVLTGPQSGHHHVAHAVAGCFATLLHDAVMNPIEVIKQRMQVYNSPYRTCTECLLKVWRKEGARAFYRSYTTQLTMNIPYQSLHFIMYEYMQDLTNEKRLYNPKAHMVSGAIAGAFAAAVTTPLDVCKTLLNTQESQTLHRTKQSKITGMFNAIRVIYRIRGIPGYFQGMQARVLFQMPSTAIAWSVYEFFKYFITSRQLTNNSIGNSNNGPSHSDKGNDNFPTVSAKSTVSVVTDFQATTKAAVTVAAASNP